MGKNKPTTSLESAVQQGIPASYKNAVTRIIPAAGLGTYLLAASGVGAVAALKLIEALPESAPDLSALVPVYVGAWGVGLLAGVQIIEGCYRRAANRLTKTLYPTSTAIFRD